LHRNGEVKSGRAAAKAKHLHSRILPWIVCASLVKLTRVPIHFKLGSFSLEIFFGRDEMGWTAGPCGAGWRCHMDRRTAMDRPVIGVVGLGTMGLGIAQVYAQAGHVVRATDAHPPARANARERLAAALAP